jgi:hypothetical protein
MKRLLSNKSCRWLAIAYLACAAIVAMLTIEHHLGVQHFWPVPFLFLLAVMAVSGFAALAIGAKRFLLGPSRLGGLLLIVAALGPAAFWAFVGYTGFGNWADRRVPNSFFMNLAKRSGASLMEAEAAWLYPHLTRGPRVVMFHKGVAYPDEDVARMEEYLDELEAKFGRKVESPIHWVRGKLLGRGGLSLYGLALGSDESQVDKAGDSSTVRLSYFDRHEAAHAVMSQWIRPTDEPPTLLSEGWAEANAAPSIQDAAFQISFIDRLPPPGEVLATLLNDEWYHLDRGLVYPCGRLLVVHLINARGGPKMLELVRTIRPDDPAKAFVEVYGVPLAEIEREAWALIPRK